jgi:hypothetical protein
MKCSIKGLIVIILTWTGLREGDNSAHHIKNRSIWSGHVHENHFSILCPFRGKGSFV